MRRIFWILALAALPPVLGACEEETGRGDSATISGRVVDLEGRGVFDVEIAVLYSVQLVQAGPARAAGLQPGGPGLGSPYPNPTEGDDADAVGIPVRVPVATTVSVSAWATLFGVPAELRRIHDGPLLRDTTLVWNLTDRFGGRLPSDLYEIRLSAESGERLATRSLLLNRPLPLIDLREEYNAITGPDGEFLLGDLPVGDSFTVTSETGTAAGTGVIRSRVILVFRAPGFLDRSREVVIGRGELVELEDLVLQPASRTEPPQAGTPGGNERS